MAAILLCDPIGIELGPETRIEGGRTIPGIGIVLKGSFSEFMPCPSPTDTGLPSDLIVNPSAEQRLSDFADLDAWRTGPLD